MDSEKYDFLYIRSKNNIDVFGNRLRPFSDIVSAAYNIILRSMYLVWISMPTTVDACIIFGNRLPPFSDTVSAVVTLCLLFPNYFVHSISTVAKS